LGKLGGKPAKWATKHARMAADCARKRKGLK
jgi:hypothetical protein